MPADRSDDADVASIASLAEPVRRRLYEVVVAAGQPLGREEAADRAGVPVHTARFHLDRLVAEGLLEVEYRRLSGRTGPGAGRPAKLYRRGPREVSVSLPARDYDLLSRILARAVARAADSVGPVGSVVSAVAREEGAAFGSTLRSSGDELARVADALSARGYEPQLQETEIRVRNCPFHHAAQDQTELVCGINLAYVTGICQGLDCTSVTVALTPRQDHCCVTVHATR